VADPHEQQQVEKVHAAQQQQHEADLRTQELDDLPPT
jgi:hypothetical protein